jgi:hypothetical protein
MHRIVIIIMEPTRDELTAPEGQDVESQPIVDNADELEQPWQIYAQQARSLIEQNYDPLNPPAIIHNGGHGWWTGGILHRDNARIPASVVTTTTLT